MHRGRLMLWTVTLGVLLAVGAARLAADAKPKTPPSPDPTIGGMLYQARCLHCHDLPNPGFISEKKWNRWMMRMRYTAGLSDEDYDLMMDYARREREARQAKMAR